MEGIAPFPTCRRLRQVHRPRPKKGMSGLAIAGIGRGGLIVIGLIGVFMLLGKACTGLKEYAEEAQKNPAKAAAMLVTKFNPDIEVVSTNDTAGEITIRDKKTGKETTLSFEDIANGKFSMTDGDGKTISVDGSQAAKDGTVRDSRAQWRNGDQRHRCQHGGRCPWPGVPQYPGLKTSTGGMRSEKDGVATGAVAGEKRRPGGEGKGLL